MQVEEVIYKAIKSVLREEKTREDVEKFVVEKGSFHSSGGQFLLEEDRGEESNIKFNYPIIQTKGSDGEKPIIIGHGLNEGDYSKLIPWALELARRLKRPIIIFPLTFHLNRRPSWWVKRAVVSYRKRRHIPYSTPMNAVISERLDLHPERIFLGALQSFWDVVEFLKSIGGADFLGYSLGGFLFLSLLLEGVPEGSKLVLFCSGSRFEDSRPQSPLIMDQAAAEKVKDFYRNWEPQDNSPPSKWFKNLFLGKGDIKIRVNALRKNILIIAGRNDKVTPLFSIEENLGTKADIVLDLGIHEVPFNAEEKDLEDQKSLHEKLKRSFVPSEKFKKVFRKFIEATTEFLGNE